MSEKIKTILAILIILIILPYIITYAIQGNVLFQIGQGVGEEDSDSDQEMKEGGEPTELLVGILSGQISMDAPKEAVKAQAVLVRTEYYRRMELGLEAEQSLSMEELSELWGSGRLQTNYEIASTAVKETAGEVLTCEGELIQNVYHKVSAGATREMKELNGEKTPYLTSVSCGMDITSPDYLAVRFFSHEEFQKALGISENTDFKETEILIEKDKNGYVKTVTVGEDTVSGDELREALELPSPCFYIKEVEGKIRIVTKGKGHGMGLSQYAACEQAKSGAGYEEILTCFFAGTKLEKK